jgi:hypothetical protein
LAEHGDGFCGVIGILLVDSLQVDVACRVAGAFALHAQPRPAPASHPLLDQRQRTIDSLESAGALNPHATPSRREGDTKATVV